MQFRDLPVILMEEGKQVLRQIISVCIGQRSDDSAIQCDISRVFRIADVNIDIAGVHVCVEEIMFKNLGEENVHTEVGQFPEVDAILPSILLDP